MKNTLTIGIMGILLFCGGLAQAESVTIAITGEVTSLNPGTVLGDSVQVSDTFTGTYTYDSSVIPNIDNAGIYHYIQNAPHGVDVLVDQFEFKTSSTQTGGFAISIANDQIVNGIYDGYDIYSNQNIPLPGGFSAYSIYWRLSDSTHTALSSTALPTTAPILSNWNWSSFAIGGWDQYIPERDSFTGFWLEGVVTNAVLIPEPLTGVLMAMGVFFLRRRL